MAKMGFLDSNVDAHTFNSSLAGISALQEFIYRHQGQLDVVYQPRMIVNALRKHAAQSLRKLDMTADQKYLSDEDWEETSVWAV